MIGLIYFLVCLFLGCNLFVLSSVVKLENNAYKGIVIAIDDDIQQSNQQENIIEAIKDMFTSGSSFLYKATGKRAYFGEVTILLPKHWNLSRPDIENAGIESYDSADIRVTFPNKGRPNNMSFTMYQEECGKGGKFIHMNLGHLLKQEPELISRTWYGDPGRWLVKHWAMYRYGIYEEHGLIGFDKFRTFYDINNSYEPTGCANERLIQGTQYNFLNASSECEIDEGEERPSKYCYYASIGRVGEEGDITSSSIAFDHTNSNIQKFCGVDETNKHQEGPPTPHNHYCKNRSTWSVIMEHDDFQNKNKPRDIKVTKPNFRFVRPNLPHRFVMVIDTSASMNNKHLQMINMAFKSVMYNLPFNSTFGLVAFNETARVLYGLETIIQFEDKEKIIGSFPTVGRGSTCIACGLEKAIEMIKNYDSSNSKACRGTKIILLTDGNENEVKRIENIIDELRKESVRIFPIAYGNYADDHLEELSKETNGITCYIPKTDKTSSDDFYNCLSQIFSIDDPSSKNVNLNVADSFFNLPISSNKILSKTVKVEGWMNVNGKQINATSQRVSIYAYVHIKNTPVQNIHVYAEITLPNGTKTETQLNDNGKQPDMIEGDGVYSRYFLHFIGNGRYAVQLVVNETIEPIPKFVNYDELFGSAKTHQHTSATRIPVGSFKVEDEFIPSEENDIYPPNAIEDFNIIHFDKVTHEIVLNWTAPGNDFDIGQASRYELKYYHKFVELQNNFDTITNTIIQNALLFGNLTPSKSGDEEKITWRIPGNFAKEFYSIYIAIRAVDQKSNYAMLSNIAIARIRPVDCQNVGSMFAHPTDCTSYMVCEWVSKPPTRMKCPYETKFDITVKACVVHNGRC